VTSAQTTPTNRISSIILFAAVAAAPFPFGSVEPTAIAFWCVVLGAAIIVSSPTNVRREHIPLVVLAGAIILGYTFVIHEQLATQPWIAKPHPLWSDAAKALGSPIAPSVSITRHQPFFALGAPLANMLAITCSFIVCIDRQRARQLLLVVAWAGAMYAIYGIAAHLLEPTKVLWREKMLYRGVLTSTFLGRNTAAVYFGSCAIVWFLLLSQKILRHLPTGTIYWRELPYIFLSQFSGPIVLPFTMLIFCVVAMLMTNSRAGVVISLLGFMLAFAIYFRRGMSSRLGTLMLLSIGGLVGLIVLQIFGGSVTGRFDIEGLSGEGRFEAYHSTLKMIGDHPWFGTGLGTFVWSFPPYRSATISMWGTWDRAHSTPLELASELGVPLTVLIALSWLVVLGILFRGVLIRRRDLIVPTVALSVAIVGLFHSCIDFSLQIPGFSIVVFALTGAGLAQSFPSISSTET
jgi:O-antigen ligase